MPETTQTSARTCTLADCIAFLEKEGDIVPPFTEVERDMARQIAASYYFWQRQEDLPDRGTTDSPAFTSYFMGIAGILTRRDPSWKPSLTEPLKGKPRERH